MRVEVFSPEAVRVWRGWLWRRRYREAVLLPGKHRTDDLFWRWLDTDKSVDSSVVEKICKAVDDWHWKQPAQIPTAIVVSKKQKEGK